MPDRKFRLVSIEHMTHHGVLTFKEDNSPEPGIDTVFLGDQHIHETTVVTVKQDFVSLYVKDGLYYLNSSKGI